MGRCSLTHQIDALNILHELRDNRTTGIGDGRGDAPGSVTAGTIPDHRCDLTKEPRRIKTIAERARESCFTRLIDILAKLISIEEDFIGGVSQHDRSLLRRKDSVDLKNICLRMALGEGGSRPDRDLRELRDCLRLIVSNLLAYVRDENKLPSTESTRKLRELSNSFPDI